MQNRKPAFILIKYLIADLTARRQTRGMYMFRLIAFASVALTTSASGAVKSDTFSWGKIGSSRQDFEEGSRRCVLGSARRDVSNDKQAKGFVRGVNVMDIENNMPPMPTSPSDDVTFDRSERQVLLRRMYNPDRHRDDLQKKLQSEVDRCLIESGYIRFLLSKKQRATLRKYKAGSEERKLYLFFLGSDAKIVSSQKVSGRVGKY